LPAQTLKITWSQ